jgi:predicted transcriptional regulator
MSHAIRKLKSFITIQVESGEKPYRSKLMICIEILCTLASNGPMKLTQLTHKVELDKSRLIPHLRLLKNRGLVEKQNLGENKIFYVVTERGLTVLKVTSPIIREAHKIKVRDFAAISSALSGAGYY